MDYLLREKVKMVVVACNTATALALDELKSHCPIGIYGVIEPGVRAAIETSSRSVLILATAAAVRSEAYPREFIRQQSGVRAPIMVRQVACPLLVPLAEEGWFDHPVTEEVIQSYIGGALQNGVETVLLGCTHYPLLTPSFRRVLPDSVQIVHGAKILAGEIAADLKVQGLSAPDNARGTIRFTATDRIAGRLPLLESLFGHPPEFELVDL